MFFSIQGALLGTGEVEGPSLPRPWFAAIVAAMASLPPARGRPGRGSAEDAAGVRVVDRDLVGELDGRRRRRAGPARRSRGGGSAEGIVPSITVPQT